MESGGIMHLMTIDNANIITESADIRASTIQTFDIEHIEFSNNQALLPRSHDIIIPKFLLINIPVHLTEPHQKEVYINNLIDNWSFNLEVGGQNILSIPFLVMNALEPYSITLNNKLKLIIPFEKVFSFVDGVPIASLIYHDVKIKLKTNLANPHFQDIQCKVICISKYLNYYERNILVRNTQESHIKEIHSLNLDSQTANKRFNINGNGLLNGIIFQLTTPNTNLQNIRKVSILLNNIARLEWDADLLDLMAQRLSSTTFYINPNMNGVGLLSPINTNTLNLSRIDNFAINIETNLEAGFNITAHFIVNNKVRIMQGMMCKYFIINYSTWITNQHQPLPTNRVANASINTQQNSQNSINWIMQPLDFEVPKDTICPILYEPINLVDDGVYKCITCNNLIGFNAFKRWIDNSPTHCCPLCRTSNIMHIYYKNSIHIE